MGGWLVSQSITGPMDSMVLVQALGGQGASGGTGLWKVEEALKKGLLEAGVEGWLCWSKGMWDAVTHRVLKGERAERASVG